MKITEITPLWVKPQLLVRVSTDAGIVGWGECSAIQPPITAAHLRHHVIPHVLGCDPFDIESIVESLFIKTYKLAGQSTAIAISGVEIALWDIMGKALKQPIYKLLGGAYRRKIPMYASSMRRDTTPQQEADRLAKLVEEKGFKGVKLKVGGRYSFDGDASPGRSVNVVREVRNRLGDDIAIMVDANSSFTAPRAIELGRRLQEFNIFHYEEPVPYTDLQATKKVADALDVPIAWGEQDWDLKVFRNALAMGAAEIVQADLNKAGGYLICKKVAALAEAFGAVYTPHQTSPFGTVANLHLAASTPVCRYAQEYNIEGNPLREVLWRNPVQVVDGFMQVPEEPGLGVELNEKVIAGAEVL